MLKLLIATTNPGKFSEIVVGLGGISYELIPLFALENTSIQIEETGKTYQENALLKARYFFNKTGMMTLAEDSGLEVDALQGELGVFTRRFGLGENATDQEWLDHFLERMECVPDDLRTATFVCSAALVLVEGEEHVFHGRVEGQIIRRPEAFFLPGLPLSSVFKPLGYDRVYAALSKEEKAEISHRGIAVGQVKVFLENFKKH